MNLFFFVLLWLLLNIVPFWSFVTVVTWFEKCVFNVFSPRQCRLVFIFLFSKCKGQNKCFKYMLGQLQWGSGMSPAYHWKVQCWILPSAQFQCVHPKKKSSKSLWRFLQWRPLLECSSNNKKNQLAFSWLTLTSFWCEVLLKYLWQECTVYFV